MFKISDRVLLRTMGGVCITLGGAFTISAALMLIMGGPRQPVAYASELVFFGVITGLAIAVVAFCERKGGRV